MVGRSRFACPVRYGSLCHAGVMPDDPNPQLDSRNVVALAQHPRYQHAEWSMTERIVHRQEQVLHHLGVWEGES